jgi:hypothetical protein
MVASCAPIPFVPLKLMVAATAVGISNTWLAVSAVSAYVRVILPNVKLRVGTMSCFAVGVIEYARLVALVATGVAVVATYVAPLDARACVAPTGTVAVPKLHTRVAALLIVTVDPVSGPVLVTATVVDAMLGNAYISDAATVAVALVRVAANVNVKLTGPLVAVIVAPMTRVCANVVPSKALVVVLIVSAADTVDPAANCAMPRASIAGFVCENTNVV